MLRLGEPAIPAAAFDGPASNRRELRHEGADAAPRWAAHDKHNWLQPPAAAFTLSCHKGAQGRVATCLSGCRVQAGQMGSCSSWQGLARGLGLQCLAAGRINTMGVLIQYCAACLKLCAALDFLQHVGVHRKKEGSKTMRLCTRGRGLSKQSRA